MQLGRARYGDDPRLLRQQPGESNLRRRSFLLLCEPTDQIYQRLIRFPVLFRKARDDVAEVVLVELCVFADRSGEKALPQRAERHEADAKLFKCRDDLVFWLSKPQ